MAPRILIAEDDALQGALLRSGLAGRGYEAELVTDGLEAVRRLCKDRYDLALLDIAMPEVDGLAAAHLLHDFLRDQDRPRLIAVTAAADRLTAQQATAGGLPFDCVVSKQHGLPALLNAIDSNLTTRAAHREAAAAATKTAARRHRLLAPVVALPALAMVSVFTAAFLWAAVSLTHIDAAQATAQRTGVLSRNATSIIGAMQNAEASQLAYKAAATQVNWDVFMADVQQVGRLLAAPASLAADGAAGFGDDAAAQRAMESRLQTLVADTTPPPAGAAEADVETPTADARHSAGAWLRGWAGGLVDRSQGAVSEALGAAHRGVLVVLVVLGFGALYSLWIAAAAGARRWRRAGLLNVSLAPAGAAARYLPRP